MDFIKGFLKDKTNLLSFFIAFIAAYLIFQNFFSSNVYPYTLGQPLWVSLDPSWGIALNYANLNNLNWGTEFSFTYGPMGYLCTRINIGENKYLILAYDLFVFINYFFLFFYSLKKSNNKIITFLIILSVCLIFPSNSTAAGALILMAFLIFWIRMSLDNPKPIYYLFQIAIVILAFYIKFNTGLIAFPLFYAGLIYNAIKRNEKWIYLISYALLPVILVFSLSTVLNVSLLPYIKSGMELISGYNEIMYLENTIYHSIPHFIIMIILLIAVMFFNLNIFNKKDWLKKITILFLFGISFLILYKQTFTRADGHVYDFFIYVSILLICNLDLHINSTKWYAKVLFVTALLIPFKFLIFDNDRTLEIAEKLPKSTYISQFNEFTPTAGMHLFPNASQLPQSVLQKIGDKTVDIYPWNVQLLLMNKLNYGPRPVIQSYIAYTKHLENMNFDHYNSGKAPEYVIYDVASIDGRYPFFDEPKVNLALIKNYKVVDKFDFDGRSLVLLQKRLDFKPVKLEKTKEYAMLIDSPLIPHEDIFYEVSVYNNLLGKVVTVIEHSPEISLEIYTEDGNIAKHRTSKSLLESGVFYDRIINETKYFNAIFEAPNEIPKVKYYKFIPKHPSQIKDKIKITEYKITR
ncbi:hypothetical protein [Flavobacterium terrisoli]|uniref:hypothetical protein n=1 Tax=Flavobacterium terrisoli TaxID=3242195 RepID=UPI002543E780|nr:hypothetical protein [Flavobacterium buctense]